MLNCFKYQWIYNTSDLLSPPLFLLIIYQLFDSLLEEIIIINCCSISMVILSDPLGSSIMTVTFKQNAWIELELFFTSDEFLQFLGPLGKQPKTLVSVVPWNLPSTICKERHRLEISS